MPSSWDGTGLRAQARRVQGKRLTPPPPPVREPHPPLSVLRRFAHLLNQSQEDFLAEAELLRLQEQVVRRIRGNQRLERDLALMDTKIGLLVKSRATLQVRPPAPATPGLIPHPAPRAASSVARLGPRRGRPLSP